MRRFAREDVFQLVFEFTFCNEPDNDALEFMLYNSQLTDDDKEYITRTYDGIIAKYGHLKDAIAQYLKNYTLDRLARTDLVALLIGVYEIEDGKEPVRVVINEAVTLAKKYGTEDSGRFVNGVLGKFAQQN